MRIQTLTFISCLFLAACGDAPDTGTNRTSQDTTAARDTLIAPASRLTRQAPKPNCPVNGRFLEGNTYYSTSQGLFVAIVADSTTRDEKLGESHRRFLVYNTVNCELISTTVLPVDRSPDFPYLLATINYNNAAQQLAIHGATQLFLYDLEARHLAGPFQPQFSSKRYGVDAQSGNIQQLEMWESYLIGYAQDYGAFAFKLNGKGKPTPVFPVAEYQDEVEAYSQAFLLPSDQGTQVLLPSYDRGDRTFRINPVFQRPILLKEQSPITAQNDRYLLLREAAGEERAIVIDLKEREKVELPSDIQRKDDEGVVDWMKVMQ